MFSGIISGLPPLLYIRHAESTANVGKTTRHDMPTARVELTPRGRLQAQQTAGFLVQHLQGNGNKRLLIAASPYQRVRRTLEPFLEALQTLPDVATEVMFDDLLIEERTGYYERVEEISNAAHQKQRMMANQDQVFQYFIMPGGESAINAAIRQRMFLNELVQHMKFTDQPPDCVLIFGHGLSGKLMFMQLGQHDWPWFWDESFPNCAVRSWNGRDQGYVFVPDATPTL